MSLSDPSIELPEPLQKPVTEQFREYTELKPEMTEVMERQLDYWKLRLADAPTLELSTDRPRPAVPSFRRETQQFRLPIDLTEGLKALSQREGVTLFMILVAGFQVLLHRYSGQDDILIGTPAFGRSRLEREGLISFFGNTLVLRTDLSGNPSFRKLLAQVREVTLGAYVNQDMPFEKLVEALNPQLDLSRNPLFQVMFVLQSVSDDKLQINEITSEFLQVDNGTTQLDLSLELSETLHGLAGVVKYATDLFEAATIDRLIGHFQILLEGIVAHPQAQLSELPLLTEPERQKLLVEWNDTTVELSNTRFIHHLFEEQVERTPQAVAVVYKDQQLTYGELNASANRLAHYLRHIGVGPEVLVGICLERSLDQMIGLLGVLKAGGAYMPLDPGYPKERLAFMLEDSASLVLLTQGRLEAPFIGMRETVQVIIDLEDASRPWASQPDTNPDRKHVQLSPENLAYVMYTSGSTGRPKGVAIEHHGFQNQLSWYIHESHLSSNDNALVVTSFAYALTQRASFGPLLAGARLVLASEPFDPQAIVKLVVKERISMMILTPSGFAALIDASAHGELGGLREVFLAGEPLEPYRLLAFPEPRPEFVNNYGATECTAAAIYYRIAPELERYGNRSSLPIGRPIWNARVYILDAHQQPMPVGVAGEIHIGGVPVGRGYLNRPELTAERFVRDPFVPEANARMFKTGDLGRWLADGTIEYLGRNDFQVKIRGLRIELGEIEAALRQHPHLREAVADVYEPIPGYKRLVAYLVPRGAATPSPSELQDFLRSTLPGFMIPSAFVYLAALPLTPNGKLDRKALPEPDQSQQVLNDDFIAPRSPVEKRLAEIWGEVLRINRIGIHDNFFGLGGHSLLATQVIVRVGEQLSVEIPLTTLLEVPTIAELAKLIENTGARTSNHSKRIVPQLRTAYKIDAEYAAEKIDSDTTDLFIFPISLPQQRLWLLDRLMGTTTNYNISRVFRLQGRLDVGALEAALNAIILRHEPLRTCFAQQDGVLVQVIQSSLSIPLTMVDLRGYPEEQRASELARLVQINETTAFDLESLPLLRFQLLRLGEEEYIFLFAFHHIISDGWSLAVFARELSALYGAFTQGQPSPLPELPIQYADYTVWQREWLQGEDMDRLLDYWKARLADAPTLELPTDRPRPAVQSFRGATQQFNLSPDLTEGLKALSRREGVTLFMTLLTAFQVLLHRYSGQDDIVIGTPSAGRGRLELEGLIGFFVNTLVLRADLSGNPSFRELLAQDREVTLGAYANQDMPFEKLVEALNPQRDHSRNPLFQVMFIFQNTSDDKLQLNGITTEVLQTDNETAKLDLALELSETPHGLAGRVEYATDLFEAATIARLIGHFQTLLEGIIAHPEAYLSKLPMLTEPEHRQLLVEWNNTAIELPDAKFIHHLFEEQVRRTPQAVAVVYKNQQLTYGELNARANQLAHYLRHIGVEPEVLVGICLERSIDQVIGWLGILKAGGAYVPLDPCYPKELLAFMLEDSTPIALLTSGQYEALFSDLSKCPRLIDLSAQCPVWATFPDINPDHKTVGLKPENLAYVIYTSGSTGKPKGVEIVHRSLQNLLPWYIGEGTELTCDDAVLVVTSMAFDVTQKVIFGPLLVGARLVLASEPFDPMAIVKLVVKERISMMTITPSGFYALIDAGSNGELSSLRRVFLGGEPMQPSKLLEMPEPRPEFFNNYGPTECTMIATFYRMSSDLEQYLNRPVPIGRPIRNVRIYILDSYRQPVPIGVAGEIYIGGVAVGRGYLNRPELTAERFVHDPFVPEAAAHMYKTGDLARWLADGTIEFLSRNDLQVKIRGFRIELSDIEATLLQHPQLREVVVDVYETIPGDKRLVAYVVSLGNPTITPTEMRDFLKLKLPEFMVPSAYVFLNALPLTPNGKLNRKALPLPLAEEASKECAAPRNEIERKLIVVWKDVLGLKNIGIHDNFFELGGHSLLAVKVVVEVNELFDTDLPFSAIYQSPTVEELGAIISSGDQQPSGYSLVPIQTQGSRPPLFAIHTITLLDLPRHLGKEQPLYFLRYGMAAENGNSSVRLPLIEDLASHYIKEMQQVQPHGPYYLLGFSFGGVIAYEMVGQLLANGHRVNLVGLLDTYLTYEKQLLPLHRIIHKFFRQSPSQLLRGMKSKITNLAKPYKYGSGFWPHIYTSAPDIACRNGYQPKSYEGRVTLFQGWESGSMLFSKAPPELAWTQLLGDRLEVQQVAGAHSDICKEPHVKILAAKIMACMDKAINEGCDPLS